MPTLHELIMLASTTQSGRVIAAVILFGLMHLIKMIPGVEDKYITTPRRRLALNVFFAMVPVGYLLLDGSVDMMTVGLTALDTALVAMGIHTGIKVIKGEPVAVPNPTLPE